MRVIPALIAALGLALAPAEGASARPASPSVRQTAAAAEKARSKAAGMGGCLRCHEMRFPYEEYLQGPHAGKAACRDCHESGGLGGAITNIVRAWNHFVARGYRTRAKYDARRLKMAQSVWKEMKKQKFRTCRGCHPANSYGDAMKELAQQAGGEAGLVCTDCHKGVAHHPPD